MQFKISDSDAVKQFDKAGVQLTAVTTRVDNRFMHYAKTGSDTLPTIIFVHGSPGSWNAFADYMKDKDLLDKYRMISIDRPGFGYSDFGKAEPMQEQSALISPLLAEWKNGKAVYLVGHSLGGPLIIQLYADNPGMIDGLVLLAASVDPAEEKEKFGEVCLMVPWCNTSFRGPFVQATGSCGILKKTCMSCRTNLLP